jgi:hypothetical protein
MLAALALPSLGRGRRWCLLSSRVATMGCCRRLAVQSLVVAMCSLLAVSTAIRREATRAQTACGHPRWQAPLPLCKRPAFLQSADEAFAQAAEEAQQQRTALVQLHTVSRDKISAVAQAAPLHLPGGFGWDRGWLTLQATSALPATVQAATARRSTAL